MMNDVEYETCRTYIDYVVHYGKIKGLTREDLWQVLDHSMKDYDIPADDEEVDD